MAVVLDPTYGPKPALTLAGGSPSTLAQGSQPFLPAGRSVTLIDGQLRTVSFAEIYRTQPWVGRACRFAAEAIARLPLQTFQAAGSELEVRRRDRTHPVAALLNRPRPRRRGFHLRWEIALSLWVHGESVHWKRRPRRNLPPTELWPLDWRLLVPIGVGHRVVAWQYIGDDVPGLTRGQPIPVEDTLHLSFAGPGGGDFGVSPLEQLGVTIRSENALQRYAEAAMRNGTRFGVAAILDPKVKPDAAKRHAVREELVDAHGGIENAFRPAVLGGGVTDIKPLAEQSAVDAELIDQRRINREEIAAVAGIPAPILGILSEAKYSSIVELHRMLYVTSLGGPLGLIGESVQAQLIDEEPIWRPDGRFVEFSLDEVLKGDTAQRWETYGVALDHGGLTLNDVRRRENLQPYDDPRADEPLIAANNVRPLRNVGAEGTNAGVAPPAALLELASRHAGRALERAARGAGAGQAVLDALDRERVARELGADLEELGLNGSSSALAAALAADLAHGLEDAQDADAVRSFAARYPLTGGAA
jgi:HK97 family phage portal protein